MLLKLNVFLFRKRKVISSTAKLSVDRSGVNNLPMKTLHSTVASGQCSLEILQAILEDSSYHASFLVAIFFINMFSSFDNIL